MSKIDQKTSFFFKSEHNFPQRLSGLIEFNYGGSEGNFFSNKAEKVLLNAQKRKKSVPKNLNCFSNCSSGHAECGFDIIAEKFFWKGRKTYAQCPKMIWETEQFSSLFS